MPSYRSDQFLITATITGLPNGVTTDLVAWESCDGFDNTVEGQTRMPGGMAPQESLGGIPKRSPGTLRRVWSDAIIRIFKALDEGAGNAPATVVVQTLNKKKEPTGEPITYTGTLGTVTRPGYGSENAEKAYLQIQVDPDGPIA